MAALDDAATDLRQTAAALQRELDQRTAERDEATAQQAATSEILGVISRSPTDTRPVFKAIVARCALCEAEFSTVARLDDGLLHLVAVHSMSAEETAAFHSLFPRPPARNFAMGRVFVDAHPVHFEDVLAEFDYDARTIEVLQSVAKYRSFFAVPIFREGRPVGVIGCGRRAVKPFTAPQIELVKTFADQAAIAIENVRLFGELEQRNRDLSEALEQQTATAEVLGIISSSPGRLEPVFDAMLASAVRICGGAFGILALSDGGGFRGVAVHGIGPQFREALSRLHRPPPNTGLFVMQQSAHTVQVLDCAAEAAYDPVRAANPDFVAVRTALHVPMLKQGALVGAILIFRNEVLPFGSKQIELVENFSKQAVIAIENARLITETREALEQQTATAEVLQVINSSPGDLAPVFDAMLERAVVLCDAVHGVLRTFDGEFFHLAAMRGEPDAVDGLKQLGAIDLGSVRADDMLGAIVRGEAAVHVTDVRETDTYRDNPVARERAETANQRTWLAVALRKDGALLGVIMIYRSIVRPFTSKQIALLQNFATQAVIAMENARLLTETREALEQQTATAEVLQVINASPGDLAPVFDAMLEKAMHLCKATFGQLAVYEDGRFRTAATQGMPAAFVEYRRDNPPDYGPGTQPARLLAGERIIQVPDLMAEDIYKSGDPNRRALVDLGGVRSSLMVPLLRNDTVLGFINIYRQEAQTFSDEQIALLQNFAGQAVIAMENARLLTETREALEQQTATAEVLQVINSSPGDLAPVFDTLLEKAMQLCGAAFGEFIIAEG